MSLHDTVAQTVDAVRLDLSTASSRPKRPARSRVNTQCNREQPADGSGSNGHIDNSSIINNSKWGCVVLVTSHQWVPQGSITDQLCNGFICDSGTGLQGIRGKFSHGAERGGAGGTQEGRGPCRGTYTKHCSLLSDLNHNSNQQKPQEKKVFQYNL